MCAGVITPIYSFVFALRNTLPPLPRRHHQGNLDQSLSLMTAWPLAWPATVMEPTTTSTQAFRSASESFADCVSFLRLLILNKDEYAKWGKHQSFLTRIFQMYPRRRYLLKSIFFAKPQTYQGITFLNSQPILWHFFGPSSQCVREDPFCNVVCVYGQCPNSFVPTNIPGKHSDHHHPRPP